MSNIQNYFDKATYSLQALEKELASQNKNHKTTAFSTFNRVAIPIGFVESMFLKYHRFNLNYLIDDHELRKEIVYQLQFNDLQKFFFLRFRIFGPLRTIMSKYIIINLVSCIEVILRESVRGLGVHPKTGCGKCSDSLNCKAYVNSGKSATNRTYFKILRSKIGFEPTKDYWTKLEKLIDIRNQIHLNLSDSRMYKLSLIELTDRINEGREILRLTGKELPAILASYKTKRASLCSKGAF